MNYKTSGILFIASGILLSGAGFMGKTPVLFVVGIALIVLGIAFLLMTYMYDGSKNKDADRQP